MLLSLLLSATWPLFSSQSDLPWFMNFLPSHAAASGTALLHVTASAGVPSYSGHPTGNGDCESAVTTAMPQARSIAAYRAQTFAAELGVKLDGLYAHGRFDEPPPPTPDANATPNVYGSCGLPKFGRAPVTASVSATYTMESAFAPIPHVVESPEQGPSRVSPFPVPTFRPPVYPVAPRGARVVTIETTAVATQAADSVLLMIALSPPPAKTPDAEAGVGPKNEADLAPVFDAIRSLFPAATIAARFAPVYFGGYTNRAPWQVKDYGADLTVTVPRPSSERLFALSHRLEETSQKLGLTQQITQNNLLDRCDRLEEEARVSAIELARAQLRRKSPPATQARLIFADERPPVFSSGICGPIIDRSFLMFGAHEVVAPQIDARVTVALEYELR